MRISIYFLMIGSAIPLILSYMLGYVEDSFAVFDALSFSCLLLATFAVSAVFSKWLMFSSVLIITALSSCLLLINHEYFLMYESYISKSTLPLLNDLLYALKHFITGSILVPLLLSVAFIVGLIFVFRKHSADLPKLLSLGVAFTALLLYFGSANIHAQRYEIQRLLLKGDKYDFKFENPVLYFARSFFEFDEAVLKRNAYRNSFSSGIKNEAKFNLPEEFHYKNFKSLIPKYTGYHHAELEREAFKFLPNIGEDYQSDIKLTAPPMNVILIVLESLRSYETISSEKHDSLTPNLNKMAKKGVYFKNFYSTNRVTVKSETAMLCGLLDTQKDAPLSVFHEGLDAQCLPKILASHGYHTQWIHGYTTEFFNRGKFLPSVGVKELYGIESFETDGYDIEQNIGWGVPDTQLFEKALTKLEQGKTPFFAEVLTLTNHQPFDWDYYDIEFPDELAKPSKDVYENYKKGIYYTDYALGQFWEKFQSSDLRENTILVITADHGVPFFPSDMHSGRKQFDTLFKMPLLIIGPEIEAATDNIRSSHLDIAPTILSLLNIREPVSFLGRPLLGNGREETDRPIFLYNMKNYGFLYGDMSCLPVDDMCEVNQQGCFPLDDKTCQAKGGALPVNLETIPAMKSYIDLLMMARYKNF